MSEQKQKHLPLLGLIAVDTAVLLILLSAFCYFHHIRNIWFSVADSTVSYFGTVADGNGGKAVYSEETGLDISGDFGASFPERFLQDDSCVQISDDAEIRDYLTASGFTPDATEDGKYVGLYRSHDICLTVLEVNTDLYYQGTGKSYREQYFVYDIYVRNLVNFYTSPSETPTYIYDLLEKSRQHYGAYPIAAVNGDYVGNANHGVFGGRNGVMFRDSSYTLTDTCVMFKDGTVETYAPMSSISDSFNKEDVYQAWDFGPALLDSEGKAITAYDGNYYGSWVLGQRNPRTGFGYYEPGHYAFVVFDGRTSDSDGIRVDQLAQMFEDMGCVRAYNMDGGNSTQAYYDGALLRDHDETQDLRTIYDIICIGELKRQ